jgi:hypothetical protein
VRAVQQVIEGLRETQIKSPVRPELVEGLAEQTDYFRLNPIMVRQLTMNGFNLRFLRRDGYQNDSLPAG